VTCPGIEGQIIVVPMRGTLRRVCLFGGGIAACLALASCGNGQNSPPIGVIAAKSAADFVHHTVGLPGGSYPSFWTDVSYRSPDLSLGSTGKVVVRGNCAAVDFYSAKGPQTAFIRNDVRNHRGKWVPEKIIAGRDQFRSLNSATPSCS
jgi:hypothetical protein